MPPASQPLTQRLQRHWFDPQGGHLRAYESLLLGLVERLYRLALHLRNTLFSPTRSSQSVSGVKSLAIGNLIVGGAGKTPAVMALASALAALGKETAILSRGYKSTVQGTRILEPKDLDQISAQEVGDEAWLLCWRTGLAVAVGKDRLASLKALKTHFPKLSVALLDDGLSQRRLRADQSLLVMDSRGFGNRHCLPLGPLREPAIHLNRFDAWIDNGFSKAGGFATLPAHCIPMTQHDEQWVSVDHWQTPERWLALQEGVGRFRQSRVLAVAGIAVPSRFFETLQSLGIDCETLPLADHDPNLVAHISKHCASNDYDVILMTEKDAVKFFHTNCSLKPKMWALRRKAQLEPQAIERLIHGL